MPVRWTTEAADQLEAIVNHIRAENPQAARTLAQFLLDRTARLETFPNMGKPGERKGTRELVAGDYIIVYRVIGGDTAEILFIWHGAQDWR